MTLSELVNSLRRIADSQRNIRYTGFGDLYKDLNSNPSIHYDVFYITPGTCASTELVDRFTLNLFYISRLLDVDGNNLLQVESIGKEVLDNIVKIFCEEFDVDTVGNTQYTFFTQRFADLTAGVYMKVTFEIPKDTCIDE